MERVFIMALLVMLSSIANSQTFDEWFRQKKTQKKYLLQQLVGLQAYIGFAKKGYSVAKNGLNLVRDIKHGEMNLHHDYFNSLKIVNPKISKYSKVADIIALQLEIVNLFKNVHKQVQQSKTFNAGELKYFNEVFSRLMQDCINLIDELTMIISENQLEMKDDERLKRIEVLYQDMQGKYLFAQSFAGEAKVLAVSRLREKNDIKSSRALIGIKN